MDWSKAKNILIVALIATNIFLLFTYMTKNHTENGGTKQEVIFTILGNKNIFIDTKLPEKYEKLPAVTIAYSSGQRSLIDKNLKRNTYNISPAAGDEEYHKAANKFLKDSQIPTENLSFSEVVRDEETVIVRYKNCYKKIVIGGSFLEVTFVDGNISNVTKEFLTPKPQSKKKLNVISPEEALLIFMSEKTGSEVIRVENMELVFWINDSGFDGESLISDTAFPAWEIRFNGGKIKYVEAYKT